MGSERRIRNAKNAYFEEMTQRVSALMAAPDNLVRYETEIARRRAELAADPVLFIWRHVKIESGDPGSPVIPFHLWPAQAAFVRGIERSKHVIAGKSRQIGLTWLVLAWMAHQLLFKPGFSGVGISREEDSAKELLRRLEVILRNLPAWITQERSEVDAQWNGPRWHKQTLLLTIHHPGRKTPDSRFVGEQSSPNSGRSFTASALLLDEWAVQDYAEEIWASAYPVVNRPDSGKVIGISTAEVNSFFQKVWDGAIRKKNSFAAFFFPWFVDPRRTRQWHEQAKKDLPLTWRKEYPETPADMFSVGAMSFFPEFTYSENTCEPFDIPEEWWRFRTLDWGFNNAACVLWIAVDENDCFWVYRELYVTGMTAGMVAEAIHDLEGADTDDPEDVNLGPADNQIRQEGGTSGPTVEEEFSEHDVFWDSCNKDRRAGWQQIHARLTPRTGEEGEVTVRLVIFKTCENLLRELENAKQNPHKPDDLDPKCEDHALDSLRYGCMYRAFVPELVEEEDERKRVWEMPRKHRKTTTWMSR